MNKPGVGASCPHLQPKGVSSPFARHRDASASPQYKYAFFKTSVLNQSSAHAHSLVPPLHGIGGALSPTVAGRVTFGQDGAKPHDRDFFNFRANPRRMTDARLKEGAGVTLDPSANGSRAKLKRRKTKT